MNGKCEYSCCTAVFKDSNGFRFHDGSKKRFLIPSHVLLLKAQGPVFLQKILPRRLEPSLANALIYCAGSKNLTLIVGPRSSSAKRALVQAKKMAEKSTRLIKAIRTIRTLVIHGMTGRLCVEVVASLEIKEHDALVAGDGKHLAQRRCDEARSQREGMEG